jgi:hypothetical protein
MRSHWPSSIAAVAISANAVAAALITPMIKSERMVVPSLGRSPEYSVHGAGGLPSWARRIACR